MFLPRHIPTAWPRILDIWLIAYGDHTDKFGHFFNGSKNGRLGVSGNPLSASLRRRAEWEMQGRSLKERGGEEMRNKYCRPAGAMH